MLNVWCSIHVFNVRFYNIRLTHLLRMVNVRCTFCCVDKNRKHSTIADKKYKCVHSKKCNIRLPYVKHALNVRYKTYV